MAAERDVRSYADIARRTGIRPARVSFLLNGRGTPPTVSEAWRIAEVLRMSYERVAYALAAAWCDRAEELGLREEMRARLEAGRRRW